MVENGSEKAIGKAAEAKKKENDKYSMKRLEPLLMDLDRYLTQPQPDCCNDSSFQYKGLGVYECEHCKTVFKNEYARVRDCVDEYGTNLSVLEIAELTKVPKRIIDLFVKDGRFIKVDKQRVCMVCHEPIETGFYCNRCALRQINTSFEERRKKNLQSGVMLSDDMKGVMHYGKQLESLEYAKTNEGKNEIKDGKQK